MEQSRERPPAARPRRLSLPLSFRQLLVVAFACIALLLSGALLQAVLALQSLAEQNRSTALGHMHLIEDVAQMDARTAALERLARQYLVLDDPVLQQRYAREWEETRAKAEALRSILPAALQPQLAQWLALARPASESIARAGAARELRGPDLLDAFSRLGALNVDLAQAAKRYVDERNQALAEEAVAQRSSLSLLLAAVIGLALLLAFAFGMWLSRPLRQVQAAITRLGEGKLDAPVQIDGPADLRELGGQLDWLRLRLAELEDNKARFLRHVSHELKTPLAALREGVALLEDETAGELTGNQREVAGILRANTLALQEQIEGLLHFNASVFGARQMRPAPVDLRALLDEAVRSQRLQAKARGARVLIEGAAPALSADADKLAVVFTNLLSNAIRFSPPGGAIRFVLAGDAEQVRVDCLDEGVGVAPRDAEKIFQPFQQGERQPEGARHGSGIGLAIVREFVAAHGGTVRLLQGHGGAHFRVELPRRPQVQEQAAAAGAMPAAVPVATAAAAFAPAAGPSPTLPRSAPAS